jgi:hypothetical protein
MRRLQKTAEMNEAVLKLFFFFEMSVADERV